METNSTNSNLRAAGHTHATEFLIILSQTVFFVLLFILLKSALIDRRGMMYDSARIEEEKLQLMAIFFAIFVVIGILMIPLESYEFIHYVVPLTYFTMLSIIAYELYTVYKKNENKPVTPRPAMAKANTIFNESASNNTSAPGITIGSSSNIFTKKSSIF